MKDNNNNESLIEDLVFYNADNLAEMLSCSRRKILDYLQKGIIDSVRFGKQYLVSPTMLRQSMTRLKRGK
ncbi:MAG: helix-turn-helix domain-containing protein [Synergistaceae bacterium]|nr:helix-turn-helix domain-containing protein [Candidatus Equadaptatus faecalis]